MSHCGGCAQWNTKANAERDISQTLCNWFLNVATININRLDFFFCLLSPWRYSPSFPYLCPDQVAYSGAGSCTLKEVDADIWLQGKIIMRTKQYYCDVIPIFSCCKFLLTCNHGWDYFVFNFYKRDEDLYKSIVWPFHSQDLRCHDGRVIPYQCLKLYFHWKQLYFVNHIISFILEIKRYLFIPNLTFSYCFFSFRKRFQFLNETSYRVSSKCYVELLSFYSFILNWIKTAV